MSESWKFDLERWLAPFIDALGHKTRARMCPAYVAGLIGAGRTELCRAIFGLDQPSAGQIRVGGEQGRPNRIEFHEGTAAAAAPLTVLGGDSLDETRRNYDAYQATIGPRGD